MLQWEGKPYIQVFVSYSQAFASCSWSSISLAGQTIRLRVGFTHSGGIAGQVFCSVDIQGLVFTLMTEALGPFVTSYRSNCVAPICLDLVWHCRQMDGTYSNCCPEDCYLVPYLKRIQQRSLRHFWWDLSTTRLLQSLSCAVFLVLIDIGRSKIIPMALAERCNGVPANTMKALTCLKLC